MSTSVYGTDWAIERVVSITDGDTLRVVRRRSLMVADGLGMDFYDTEPKGVAIRLITLDTPEHNEVGWADAKRDVARWIDHYPNLRIETWPGGGFDRLLGDIYVAGDRSNTLSQWMLRYGNNGAGWLPYLKGA